MFGISIVLTRLLSPTEFGIMGMAMVVIAFARVFLEMGFNRAIIQQSEVSQIQYSTVFYLNAGVALLLTLLCFFAAEPLAVFYKQPLITPVFRVVSVSFLLNGLTLVPSALLYKRLHIRANSIQTIVAAVLSGVAGIWMAYHGYGVWSLVVQSLANSAVLLVLNFYYSKWWPQWAFSLPSIRPLWAYGSKLFASGLLDAFYTRLDTFIIAKIFSPATLGHYNRAQSMDSMVKQFSAGSMMGALIPYIAQLQNDRPAMRELYLKYLHAILFVSFGICGALFLVAKPLFVILFTARWNYAAELFQLMTISGFGWPVSALMVNIISGSGNSSAFLRLEVLKRIIILPVYIFGFLLGLKGFIVFLMLVGLVTVGMNAAYAGREIALGLRPQIITILGYFAIAAACCGITYLAGRALPLANRWVELFAYAGTFAALYLACGHVAKLRGYTFLPALLRRFNILSSR
jgi:O-antigen/teichoic acid export membrane protein